MLCLPALETSPKANARLAEFRFSSFQAPVISAEDFIQWGWKKLGGKREGPNVLRELASWWAIVK
jgi:hypothetical protein